MGIAVIFLIILLIIGFVAIPVLIRVFRDAANRNPNMPWDGDDENRRK